MSADNYYHIMKKDGRFYAVHRFMSDDSYIEPRKDDPGYDTFPEAYTFAKSMYEDYPYPEYGIHIAEGVLE